MFHVETFVVPRSPSAVAVADLLRAQALLTDLDWKLRDAVIVPVAELPSEQVPPVSAP